MANAALAIMIKLRAKKGKAAELRNELLSLRARTARSRDACGTTYSRALTTPLVSCPTNTGPQQRSSTRTMTSPICGNSRKGVTAC